MILHELSHIYNLLDGEINYSTRLLGYFSDIQLANNAISQYLRAPGYCDTPLAFTMRQCSVNGECKYGKVYATLIYVHDQDYEHLEHVIDLGLFANKKDALGAISQFQNDNKNFYNNTHLEIEEIVDTYVINKKYCEDGFVVFKQQHIDKTD